MSTPSQVANAFAVEFFERLVRKPDDIGAFYGPQSTLTLVEFEFGTEEKSGDAVPRAVAAWAARFMGCQLVIGAVRGAPVAGGVNVYVDLKATSATAEHHCQMFATLEEYASGVVNKLFVRHQVLTCIGKCDVVQAPAAAAAPPQPEQPPRAPTPAAAPEPEPEPEPEAVEEPAAAAPEPEQAPEPEPEPEQEPEQEEEEPQAPSAPAAAAAQKPATPAPAAAPEALGSWAARVRAGKAHAGAAPHHAAPQRVVANDVPKKTAAPAPAAPAKGPARPPRRPVGERLMLTAHTPVTDEEVYAALGPLAADVVSLRNRSSINGVVFFDFAEGVAAFEKLPRAGIDINADNKGISVYHQRERN